MDHADLEDLISRCALRDRAAFEALFDATSAKLLAVCLRVLSNKTSAEDAMQDAYVKIWTHAGRYQTTGHSPMTWLITIARNTAIDRLRKRKFASDVDDPALALASPDPGPEAMAVAASSARRLSGCMDELPPERAAAVRGAYLEGRSYAELAEDFKQPLNTMRTWLRRGLIALRECMSDG